MSKRPAFQFYPSDWRNDPGLRLCSIAARGLWMDMMCLMHEGQPYGHLTVMGRPMSPESLARLVGEGAAIVKRWLKELAENEVYSLTSDGVVFSRRMVRDEEVREARAAGGKAGAEHGAKGAEHGIKGGRPKTDKPPSPAEARGVINPPPSTSSSSPSAEQGSDADASGDEAAGQSGVDDIPEKPVEPSIDPLKVMFDSGIALFAEEGKSSQAARALLGKWRQQHGPEAVIIALGKAKREGAIDLTSFMEGCLKNGRLAGNDRHEAQRSGSVTERAMQRAAERLGIEGPGFGGQDCPTVSVSGDDGIGRLPHARRPLGDDGGRPDQLAYGGRN